MKKNGMNIKRTALVSALMLATGAQAATINVDGVTCTLGDAITAANTDAVAGGCTAGSGADVIELPADSTQTLTAVLPDITSNVTINANNSTIERDSGDYFVVLSASAYGSLTLNDATVTGGQGDAAQNLAGGISAYDATLIMNNCVVTGNTGGAVRFIRGIDSEINNSVIENNDGVSGSRYYTGGVIANGGNITINNSTIAGNSADSVYAGGGGIYATGFSAALTLNINNSTISGNSSTLRGGGISHLYYNNPVTINLTNVTVAANTSGGNGGGISNDTATINISQSIVSGNTGTGGSELDSSGGTVTVDDYNLFGLNNDAGVVGVTVGASDIVPTVAALTDIVDVNLQNNGGPTPTHLPVAGGPAVDVIPGASCALGTDQIGNLRPLGSGCDVGAVELDVPTTFLVGGSLSGLLSGNSVTLQNNAGDDLNLTADGAFVFATALNDLDGYEVTVLTQPTSPNQTCTVSNGGGTIAAADVTSVEVSCDNLDLIFRNGFEAPPVQ